MRTKDIDCELRHISFEFFYWFSRFEFALKKNDYLENTSKGSKASPGWENFIDLHYKKYRLSEKAQQFIDMRPKKQVVGSCGNLDWEDIDIQSCKSELCKLICVLRVVRNNLFHGGKHENVDKDRNKELLRIGKDVLDEMIVLGGFYSDCTEEY